MAPATCGARERCACRRRVVRHFGWRQTLGVRTRDPGDSCNSRRTPKADDVRSRSDKRRVLQSVTEVAA